ncbi:MAG TPA: ATP-binding protein [Rugosimonospora sp.]
MQPRQILTALAELAPAPGERVFDVCRAGQTLQWLPDPDRAGRSRGIDRLAAMDALSRDERILRRGWAFVVGSMEVDGVRRTVRLPLLTQPVRLERGLRGYRVVPAGDLELTALVEDRALAGRLEEAPGLGSSGWLRATGTAAWIRAAAEASGLIVSDVLDQPPKRPADSKLVAVAAAALFVIRDVRSPGMRDTLLTWAARPGLEATALAPVYGLDDAGAHTTGADGDGHDSVDSPLPLNAAQREAVRRTRTERLVVVSGPPGNGKSHALVAAALDAVDRGGCVLVAAQSPAAVDALAALLRRYPGPTPVLFGDAERRDAIVAELGQGAAVGVPDRQLRADDEAVAAATGRVSAVRSAITAALDLERRAASLSHWAPLIAGLDAEVPGPFRPDFDLSRARRLAARAFGEHGGETTTGWWRRRARDLAYRRLRRAAGAAAGVPPARIRAALDAAEASRAAAALAAAGGTDLGAAWRELTDADAALATSIGTAMRHRAASARRWTRQARRSAVVLATALQAGRNRRREMLASLDGAALVRALPLWIGTITDVEDLLPPVPGLFDLVIIDEGVHVDQIRAAPVFARARRALVAGDPRQLRFVSFVADVDVSLALERQGLGGMADRLDVRRVSAFDVAAGAAPVTALVEHYRSAPHLIEFSAHRFYRDRIALVTRHPRNEAADLIDVVRVAGTVADGVNRAEVDAVVDLIRSLTGEGHTDIAVVTPFRAQADALESALLAAFTVEQIEGLRLRSGTVHAYQGSEADIVIAALGLVDGDSPARRRFAADPNLFNVLITRARRRMVIVTSLTSATGIIGDYLAYASAGPSPAPQDPPGPRDSLAPRDSPAPDRQSWAGALATRLHQAGVPVRGSYPVGTWRLDLCAGTGDDAFGLICEVHPGGTESHIERQRTLLGAGWRLVDAFPSRWAGDPVRAAIEVSTGPCTSRRGTPPG